MRWLVGHHLASPVPICSKCHSSFGRVPPTALARHAGAGRRCSHKASAAAFLGSTTRAACAPGGRTGLALAKRVSNEKCSVALKVLK